MVRDQPMVKSAVERDGECLKRSATFEIGERRGDVGNRTGSGRGCGSGSRSRSGYGRTAPVHHYVRMLRPESPRRVVRGAQTYGVCIDGDMQPMVTHDPNAIRGKGFAARQLPADPNSVNHRRTGPGQQIPTLSRSDDEPGMSKRGDVAGGEARVSKSKSWDQPATFSGEFVKDSHLSRVEHPFAPQSRACRIVESLCELPGVQGPPTSQMTEFCVTTTPVVQLVPKTPSFAACTAAHLMLGRGGDGWGSRRVAGGGSSVQAGGRAAG